VLGVSNHNDHPNRNHNELKKSQLFSGFPLIWLNNLKSVGCLENQVFHLKY